MLRVFQDDIADQDHFVITLELVPGKESTGRAVDTVMGIARDAFADGRVSAASITDNPGGNPSLSPDVIGHEIFKVGMDVIVHFTCRDLNRVGMESRALQLAMMGMKNILALTGDYTGKGFGGQGAPVFDLDSVNLLVMLDMLSARINESGDPDGFFNGCAVSPFKHTEAESFAQYAKLCRKAAAGAQFIITQLGYDAAKFKELIDMLDLMGQKLPALGSVYVLTPKSAEIMNRGNVPGAVVSDDLLAEIRKEWQEPAHGRVMAIERAARLGAVLKGLGYKGMHLGGIHKDFAVAAKILDRMAAIQNEWEPFLDHFHYPESNGFYAFSQESSDPSSLQYGKTPPRLTIAEHSHYRFMNASHRWFFNTESRLASLWRLVGLWLDAHGPSRKLTAGLEYLAKGLLLDCEKCGDCGIQHLAFLCPESQCPKHIRNGACGGSRRGRCEVFPERYCVWHRTYRRWAVDGATTEMVDGCIPPRIWELNRTSSWLNFHLKRDHQSASTQLILQCRAHSCHLGNRLRPEKS